MADIRTIINRIQDMESEVIQKSFFALFYGSYGTGKTTLLAGIAQALRGSWEPQVRTAILAQSYKSDG